MTWYVVVGVNGELAWSSSHSVSQSGTKRPHLSELDRLSYELPRTAFHRHVVVRDPEVM